MKQLIIICLLLFSFILAKADVGETYELKNKRQEVLHTLTKGDSIYKMSKAELLQLIEQYKEVVSYDDQIFSSYQSTINRTVHDEYEQKRGNNVIMNIAFLLSLLFVFTLLISYRQNKLLKEHTDRGYSLSSLVKEIVVVSSPLFQKNTKVYKVNKLLYISLLVMALFVFLGLLHQL